ncbi:MAG: 4-vinyl reductase [Promethearchaeati archaeon SRVP18_Atabeyarchaeia-1]
MSGINEFAEAVAKLLQNVSYDYGKGILKAVNMRFLIFSSDSYVSVQKRIESLVGFDAAGVLLYEANREAGRSSGQIVRKSVEVGGKRSRKIVEAGLEFMRTTAWGRWELVGFDNLQAVFVVRDSPIAESYGRSDRAVCHQIRGLIAGFAEFFSGERRECVEVLCRSKGDDHCEFIVAAPEDITKIALERMRKR